MYFITKKHTITGTTGNQGDIFVRSDKWIENRLTLITIGCGFSFHADCAELGFEPFVFSSFLPLVAFEPSLQAGKQLSLGFHRITYSATDYLQLCCQHLQRLSVSFPKENDERWPSGHAAQDECALCH